jgi:hypothetical protein
MKQQILYRDNKGRYVSGKKIEQEDCVKEAITEFLKDNAWVENDNQGKDIFFVTDWLINNGVKVLFGMFVIVATLYLVVRI